MRRLLFFLLITAAFLVSCGTSNKNDVKNNTADSLTGKLVIFHAGSLSVPVKIICDSFKLLHPKVEILTEAAGSKECARKICNLKKPCDIMLSSDYKVIDDLLVPEWADWNIEFATNEMTIVYKEKSRYANEINKDNWFDILMKKDVAFSRSDPNSDPCGVRSLMTIQLAEKFYNKPGLSKKMSNKDLNYMRPKETDLLALLESGTIDYIFLYRSVAEQHKLKYLILPDEINMKKQDLADYYSTAKVETTGKKPGEKITETGAPMIYGLTIPKNAPNYKVAEAFVAFLLEASKGMAIMEANGQPSVVPSSTNTYEKIPQNLKKFAKP
jgi:molybdate/tungstate transport system substrate-binding protein